MPPDVPSMPPGGPGQLRPASAGAGPAPTTPGPAAHGPAAHGPAAPGPAAPPPATPPAAPADRAALGAFSDPFAEAMGGADDLEGLPPLVPGSVDSAALDDAAETDLDWRLGEALVFDFGHAPRRGSLWDVSAAGEVVWADNGRRVTPAQADRMPAAQRAAYYRLQGVEPAPPRP